MNYFSAASRDKEKIRNKFRKVQCKLFIVIIKKTCVIGASDHLRFPVAKRHAPPIGKASGIGGAVR
jgi:hypothetical protein